MLCVKKLNRGMKNAPKKMNFSDFKLVIKMLAFWGTFMQLFQRF
jgi:hypothetical protein